MRKKKTRRTKKKLRLVSQSVADSSCDIKLTLFSAPKKKTRTAEPPPDDDEEEVIEADEVDEEEVVGDEEDEVDGDEDDEDDEATGKNGAPAENLKNAGVVPKASKEAEVEDDDD